MFEFAAPPEWTERALCAEVGGDLFWPEKGDQQMAYKAIAICGRCEVRAECLQYAIENGERDGVWGGVLPRARRGMRAA